MVRRTLLILAATAAGYVGAAPAPASAAIPCGEPGLRLITQTATAQAFARCRGRELRYYGRLIGGRSFRLDRPGGFAALQRTALSGLFVGYVERHTVKNNDQFAVRARDLRTGEDVHAWAENSEGPTQRFYGPTDLVVAPTGAIAWIVPFDSDADSSTIRYEVRVSDAGRKAAVLDAGVGIDPKSLALAGSSLYWTHDGRPVFAAISGAPETRPSQKRRDAGRAYSACRADDSSTLLASARARVYRRRERLYGCLFRSRERRVLGVRHNLGLMKTAGRFVAFSYRTCSSGGGCNSDVYLSDLSEPARMYHRRHVFGPSDVTDLVLRATGTVAVIADFAATVFDPPGTPPRREIWKVRNGQRTQLDSGIGIASGSLALRNATLYWTKDGQPRSAQLV